MLAYSRFHLELLGCFYLRVGNMRISDSIIESNPAESARSAGLRYVSDQKPGFRRQETRDGFCYLDQNGKTITDTTVLGRIKSLAIPPAWQQVWICPVTNGHIQATGRDAKGRKQYRYHPKWRLMRDEVKYERVVQFGKALPSLREKVEADLRLQALPMRKVLAAIVKMLDLTGVRIGNEEYAKTNQSFGLTTLLTKHVRIEGAEIELRFRGKSRVQHALKLRDRRMANIIKRLRDLPGQELFQYIDENGEAHSVDSGDVNAYLHELAGEDYTAKDFRTWLGTMLATLTLLEMANYNSQQEAKTNVDVAVRFVAEQLGNTPRICRNCYIHPAVFETYLNADKWNGWRACVTADDRTSRCVEEIVIDFLERHTAIVI